MLLKKYVFLSGVLCLETHSEYVESHVIELWAFRFNVFCLLVCHTVHSVVAFHLHEQGDTAAWIKPVTFGSAAKALNYCTPIVERHILTVSTASVQKQMLGSFVIFSRYKHQKSTRKSCLVTQSDAISLKMKHKPQVAIHAERWCWKLHRAATS